MKKYRCEMCGKKVLRVHDHHVIPWYLSHDDSESNIMRLCLSCHRKADANFNTLILRGRMDVADATSKRARTRYHKKYIFNKILAHFKLLKNTYYKDTLEYNVKTGRTNIYQYWWYQPYKYNSRRGFKSHYQLAKAASAKGQTILSGGA